MAKICNTSLIFLCLFKAVCYADQSIPPLSDRIKDGLIGAVKSVEWKKQDFNIVNGEKEWQDARLWRKEFFDKNGFFTRKEIYDPGDLLLATTYSANKKGKLAVSKYRDGTEFYRQYDRNGKVTEERYVNENNKLKRRWVYKWDDENRKDDSYIYGEDGQLESRGEWYYNDRFQVIRKRGIPESGMEVLYEYDSQGRISRKEMIQYNYGDRWITVFDEGREVKREQYSLDKEMLSVQTFKYEFDDHGNWIKQTKIYHSVPGQEPFQDDIQIITRTIKYY